MRAAPLVAVLAVLPWAPAASACPPIAGGSPHLSEIDADQRIEFIRSALLHEAKYAHIWSWTWVSLYSSASVGTMVQALLASPDSRVVGWVNSGASAIGAASVAVVPLHVMGDAQRLDRLVRASAAGGGGGDRCALLAQAEKLLVRDADNEAFGKSALVHVGSFAFNLGVGLMLGFGFDHWTAARQFLLTGIVVGEVQINTEPGALVPLLARYREGRLERPAQPRVTWSMAPGVGANGYGLSLRLTY